MSLLSHLFQVDNQLLGTTHPVLLSVTPGSTESTTVDSGSALQVNAVKVPSSLMLTDLFKVKAVNLWIHFLTKMLQACLYIFLWLQEFDYKFYSLPYSIWWSQHAAILSSLRKSSWWNCLYSLATVRQREVCSWYPSDVQYGEFTSLCSAKYMILCFRGRKAGWEPLWESQRRCRNSKALLFRKLEDQCSSGQAECLHISQVAPWPQGTKVTV